MELRKTIQNIAITAMSVVVAILAGALTLTTLPLIEARVMPVVSDWRVTRVEVDDQDLIVEGTVIKHRNCKYIPPPRARTTDGVNLLVRSDAPAAGISWPAGTGAQSFGPWRVIGGAGRQLEFYYEHTCHAGYTLFSPLGKLRVDE